MQDDVVIEAQKPEKDAVQPAEPHVIVVGNEKGGAGKTTVSMHIVAALQAAGKSVGTIDLDLRQRSLTRYMNNREIWIGRRQMMPSEHIAPEAGTSNSLEARQKEEGEGDRRQFQRGRSGLF